MPSKIDRLMNAIRSRITSGEFGPGDRLPSGAEMCREYDVSMQTVRIAVERLKAEGAITSAAGSGYYVAERTSTPPEQRTREE